MQRQQIWTDIEKELKRQRSTRWPDHPAAMAGMVLDPAGKLLSNAMDWKYNRAEDEKLQAVQIERMRIQAIETIAAGIRFLENLK